jgi:hypothetical protein
MSGRSNIGRFGATYGWEGGDECAQQGDDGDEELHLGHW